MIYFPVIITVVISMVTFNLVSVVVVVLVQVTLIHRQVQPALKVQRV
jgi:maltodextrin utilization protein YvdJ